MTTSRNKKSLGLRLNLLVLRFSRRWLRIALTLLGIYITLPFVAPTLMKLGISGPAKALYFIYSPFCHQFPFRSFFLFGEQSVYPLSSTGTDLKPFEAYMPAIPELAQFAKPQLTAREFAQFQWDSKFFLGSEQMGYKVTLCERDISIYVSMFLGGLAYSRVRRRLRPVPIWLYVFLGLVPIGLDGLSQLLGYPPFNLWPPRETLPVFRVLTGATFGLMNVWLGFPYLELSMRDTRQQIEAKLARAGIQLAGSGQRP